MLKIHFVQKWFNISDPLVEEEIYDRQSFWTFLELDLFADRVPDETTILNFRHLLEKHKLGERIFALVNKTLQQRGIILSSGTIVDATLISAPSSTKSRDKARDPEMSSTKKHGKWHFGMKASIGGDAKTGVIHSLATATAKVHDSKLREQSLHGDETLVGGDKGYANDSYKRKLRAEGKTYAILEKAKRGKKLSAKQQRRNRRFAPIRAKVEHLFHTLKNIFGHQKTRYRGLEKNTNALHTIFALTNLYRQRKKLLPALTVQPTHTAQLAT